MRQTNPPRWRPGTNIVIPDVTSAAGESHQVGIQRRHDKRTVGERLALGDLRTFTQIEGLVQNGNAGENGIVQLEPERTPEGDEQQQRNPEPGTAPDRRHGGFPLRR